MKTIGVEEKGFVRLMDAFAAWLSWSVYRCDESGVAHPRWAARLANQSTDTEVGIYRDRNGLRRPRLWVVVRGTEASSWKDWVHDAWATPTRAGFHRGFETAAMSVWPDVCREMRRRNPSEVVFTGHSMGGAVAEILAYLHTYVWGNFSSDAVKSHVITFGAPKHAVRWCAPLPAGHTRRRFVCRRDLVPHLPLLLYRHLGAAYDLTPGVSKFGLPVVLSALSAHSAKAYHNQIERLI